MLRMVSFDESIPATVFISPTDYRDYQTILFLKKDSLDLLDALMQPFSGHLTETVIIPLNTREEAVSTYSNHCMVLNLAKKQKTYTFQRYFLKVLAVTTTVSANIIANGNTTNVGCRLNGKER